MGDALGVVGSRVLPLPLLGGLLRQVELLGVGRHVGERLDREAVDVARLAALVEPVDELRDEAGETGRDVGDPTRHRGGARLRLALEVLVDLRALPLLGNHLRDLALRPVEEVEEGHRVPGPGGVVDGLGSEHDQHLRALGLRDERLEHREDGKALAEVRALHLEDHGELARDAAGDLDNRQERALSRDPHLELLLAGLRCAGLRRVDEVLEPRLHACGLVGDLRVERHLDLAAEGRRAVEPGEQGTVPTEERCPAVLFVRVRDAPDEDVVRLGHGAPRQLADGGPLARAEPALEEDHRATACGGIVVVLLQNGEVVLAHDVQGSGICHGNIPKREGPSQGVDRRRSGWDAPITARDGGSGRRSQRVRSGMVGLYSVARRTPWRDSSSHLRSSDPRPLRAARCPSPTPTRAGRSR